MWVEYFLLCNFRSPLTSCSVKRIKVVESVGYPHMGFVKLSGVCL